MRSAKAGVPPRTVRWRTSAELRMAATALRQGLWVIAVRHLLIRRNRYGFFEIKPSRREISDPAGML